MHRLSSCFVLGYHGCDTDVGEQLLAGEAFQPSDNDYDWLGPGIYVWEANPRRGLEFATEAMRRRGSGISQPFVIGAVIDLGRSRFAGKRRSRACSACRQRNWRRCEVYADMLPSPDGPLF